MSCVSDSSQPFPETGFPLNLSLNDLRQAISGTQEEIVYSYIVASVKNPKGNFIQTGSAPNFQGNVISLCTCKHFMRSFRTIDSWPGTWIAGFTGIGAGEKRNALIYLMKVKIAFESYYDLWFSGNLPDAVKQAKLADKNKFGDIFQPNSKLIDKRGEFDFEHYRQPIPGHVHTPKDWWHKDINYSKGVGGRKSALLIGDTQYSFLWNKPILFHSHQLSQGQKKDDLQALLALLRDKDES